MSSEPDGEESVVEEIELPLAFSVGQTSIPLGELGTIQAGHIFLLDTPLEAPVTITVNGSTYGRGRLVVVNNQLGVKLEALHNDDS